MKFHIYHPHLIISLILISIYGKAQVRASSISHTLRIVHYGLTLFLNLLHEPIMMAVPSQPHTVNKNIRYYLLNKMHLDTSILKQSNSLINSFQA